MFEKYFIQFRDVVVFYVTKMGMIFTRLYNHPDYAFLFNMALLPVILLLAFDILMSFILSYRTRRLVLFNVLSARSWNVMRFGANQNRLKVENPRFRYFGLTVRGNKLRYKLHFKLKKLKSNLSFRNIKFNTKFYTIKFLSILKHIFNRKSKSK